MDCPHEVNCVKKVPTNLKALCCAVCKSRLSPWLCLSCGIVHCGRYINRHAKLHYKENKSHCISIDCNSLDAFCYSCDEYVRNDVIPRSIIDKLNALHEQEYPISNSPAGSDDDEDLQVQDGQNSVDYENSKSSRISSNNNMTELMDESNSSLNSSSSSAIDDGNKPTTSCDQSSSSNPSSRKRTAVVEVDIDAVINGGARTRRTSASKSGQGNIRCRSNNGRFQKSNRNTSPPITGQNQQRNLRKKSGEATSSEDDLNIESTADDGVSESKKRKLDDNNRSQVAKVDNSKNNSPRKNYSNTNSNNNNNSINRRAKENNESMDKTQHKHGIVGLRNLGNTCFMNSVLQSLSKINEFSCYISHIPPPDELKTTISSAFNGSKSKPLAYSTRSRKNLLLASQNSIISSNLDTIDMNSEEFLTSELQKIVILLNTRGSAAVSPDGLFTIIWEVMPRFRGYQQQDAHEFLRYMLDRIHVELIHFFPSWDLMTSKHKRSSEDAVVHSVNGKNRHKNNGEGFLPSKGYKARNSIVTSMFGGTLQNEVQCGVCGVESKKNDPFLDLSLDIPLTSGDAKLEDCLSRFVDVEELSDADKYFCSNCKTHQKSTKRFWIRRLPNVLCLHLKRFRWSNYLRTKLDQYVQFPLTELDMSDFILRANHTRSSNECCKYDLAAVIVHHGSGVGTGHYTAFAKKDEKWYHFNDSTVKPSEESVVAKCKAYILFYTRNEPTRS